MFRILLLLVFSVYAKNTTYKDGTKCQCDSIVVTKTAKEARRVTGDTNFTEDALREIPFTGGEINGIVKRYYKTGQLEYETQYKDGKIEGIKKGYYVTGELEYELLFINNKAEGIKKGFYVTGELEYELPFIDGKAEGIKKGYYVTGELEYELPFIDGKAEGIKKEFVPFLVETGYPSY